MAEVNLDVAMQSTSEEILDAVQNMETNLSGSLTANVVKSIQHKTLTYINTTKQAEIAIDTVDPAKTLVLLERLAENSGNGTGTLSYTLTANNISVDLPAANGTLGFWIIEFY